MPDTPNAYWEIGGSTPNDDSQHLTERFVHLMEAQPHIQSLLMSLVTEDKGAITESYAKSLDDMVVVGNVNSAPDLELRQAQQAMSLYQDIGLVSKAFTVEIGLKALLSLCGQEIKRWHLLLQLYDLLHPVAQGRLTSLYPLVEESFEVPRRVPRMPSIQSIFSTYNQMYTQIRYRSQLLKEGPILSAWFHLDLAANTILLALLSHRSNIDMKYAFSASVEQSNPDDL